MPNETWSQAFQRRLEDGTAWTTGWTIDEIQLPLTDRYDDLIAEAVFDSDGICEMGSYTLNRVDDTDEIEVWHWEANVPVLKANRITHGRRVG